MINNISIFTQGFPAGDDLGYEGWTEYGNQMGEFQMLCKLPNKEFKDGVTAIWFDDEMDLHCNWGPAIIHTNGWVFWYLHGAEVTFEDWLSASKHINQIDPRHFDHFHERDVRLGVDLIKEGLVKEREKLKAA